MGTRAARSHRWLALAVATAGLVASGCRPPRVAVPVDATQPPGRLAPAPSSDGRVALLSHAVWPTALSLEGLAVGGLSDLVYDAEREVWWAVVDDPVQHPPARLLRFAWRPPAPPEPLGWLFLREGDGAPLATAGADLEGLALLPGGGFLVSSEGQVADGIAPWVGRFDAEGRLQGRLEIPAHFAVGPGRGPRHNAGLEALATTAEGLAVAGMERALEQDEPETAADGSSAGVAAGRLLVWPVGLQGPPREWRYPLDPPHAPPPVPGALRVAGLVDLLPIPEGGLLTLERSFVAGAGFAVRLFATGLLAEAEVSGRDTLAADAPAAAGKRLVLDLAELGVPLDNYEGIEWYPAAGDGERVLVVVSDNNFSATQDTHWLALRWPR